MSLRIAIYPRHAHAKVWQEAFAAGLRRYGIEPQWSAGGTVDCDLAVVWSVNEKAAIARQVSAGRPYLVMERGYLGDWREWCSLGFNGLNGRATFANGDCPADRWEQHFAHLMKAWRDVIGGSALILGQVRGDAALRGIDPAAWAGDVAARWVVRWPGMPIAYRPHPGDPEYGPRHVPWTDGSLADALAHARVAITLNSNAGVDAALAGVPVVALDRGSMAWAVAAHDLAEAPIVPDRRRWAADLAYCQWNLDEIARGAAWDHLRGVRLRAREVCNATA